MAYICVKHICIIWMCMACLPRVEVLKCMTTDCMAVS
jgi:hypothetical protein